MRIKGDRLYHLKVLSWCTKQSNENMNNLSYGMK